jgi:hypothetical protein
MPAFYMDWKSRLKRPYFGVRNRLRVRRLATMIETEDAVRHVLGPPDVPLERNEVIVFCVVRNGASWMPTFLRHHFALGVKHIVFVDNGSTDRTVEIASQDERVTVWTTELPFSRWHPSIKHWLAHRYARGRWSLTLDIDELFDYPRSSVLPLPGLLSYLEHHGYRTMVAHALDMFADAPLSELRGRDNQWLPDVHRFYDLEGVSWRTDCYWVPRNAPPPGVAGCIGGIRESVFGSRALMQTRHALALLDDRVRFNAYDSHFHVRAPVADVTAVLLHYKFVGHLFDQAKEAIRLRNYSGGSKHYRVIEEVLSRDPELRLRRESARELEGVDSLVDQGFLAASPAYLAWVERHGAPSSAPPVAPPR